MVGVALAVAAASVAPLASAAPPSPGVMQPGGLAYATVARVNPGARYGYEVEVVAPFRSSVCTAGCSAPATSVVLGQVEAGAFVRVHVHVVETNSDLFSDGPGVVASKVPTGWSFLFEDSGKSPADLRVTVERAKPSCVGSVGTFPSDWVFKAQVTDSDGLALVDARLGVRRAVRDIRVPYTELNHRVRYELTPSATTEVRGHDGVGRSDLVDMVCRGDRVVARYRLALPAATRYRVVVDQTYLFRKPGPEACEASGQVTCAKFHPMVSFRATGDLSGFDDFRAIQRFDYAPDDTRGANGKLFRDRDGLGRVIKAETAGDHEFSGPAIVAGGRTCVEAFKKNGSCTWDNYHGSPGRTINEPGLGGPGCPACVHMHWSWAAISVPYLGVEDFSDGHPAVLAGSKQTSNIAVVKAAKNETDPVLLKGGYQALVSTKQKLDAATHRIVFWDFSSPGLRLDRVEGPKSRERGDTTWPTLVDSNGNGINDDGSSHTHHGSDGSIFFVAASEQSLKALPILRGRSGSTYSYDLVVNNAPCWEKDRAVWVVPDHGGVTARRGVWDQLPVGEPFFRMQRKQEKWSCSLSVRVTANSRLPTGPMRTYIAPRQ